MRSAKNWFFVFKIVVTPDMQIPSLSWTAYNVNFKLVVMRYAKETYESMGSRVYSICGANVDRGRQRTILGSSITRKLFCA